MTIEVKKVAVAGPNGSLGKSVVEHLTRAGFDITLLTRSVEKTKNAFPGPGLKIVEVEYSSTQSLTKILQAEVGVQDALVVLINRNELQAQINLMEAALAVGITYFVPSAFGISTLDSFTRTLPIWDTKVRLEEYIVKGSKEGRFTFTGIQTGAFFDWALERGIFLNLKDDGKPTIVFDSGDVPFSATVMDDIGKAVTSALLRADVLQNRWICVHSVVVTQNMLLELAKEVRPDREFKVFHVDTEAMEKQAWERYNAGERGPDAMRGFMPRATFGKKLGLFEETANELLGVSQWTDAELKRYIADFQENNQ